MSHDEEERSCASEWTSDSSESESSDVDDDAPCDEEEESAGSDDDSASASDGSDAVLRPPPDETPFQHAPGAPHVGRVWSPALPHLHLDTFRAFPDFLPGLLDADGAGDGGCATSSRLLTRVVRDCRVAKSVEAAADGEQYSSGSTYWLAASDAPWCALEHLARRVFQLHTRDVPVSAFDPKYSGAEWWTQVLDDPGEDEIGAHWDKDYGTEAADVNVHPHVGTVTYLSDVGAPTVMLPLKTKPRYSADVRGRAPRVPSGTRRESLGKNDAGAFVSYPAVGKHVAFDGAWLHAAPSDLAAGSPGRNRDDGKESAEEEKAPRVTFLVNVWLDYVPSTVVRLSRAIAERMSTEPYVANDGEKAARERPPELIRLGAFETGAGGAKSSGVEAEEVSLNFLHAEKRHKLKMDVPRAWMERGGEDHRESGAVEGRGRPGSTSPGGSFGLLYGEGRGAEIFYTPKGKRKAERDALRAKRRRKEEDEKEEDEEGNTAR